MKEISAYVKMVVCNTVSFVHSGSVRTTVYQKMETIDKPNSNEHRWGQKTGWGQATIRDSVVRNCYNGTARQEA